MCAIAGELWYGDGAPADTDAVRRMSTALAHRGPDDEGLYADGSVCLGHRRLAIIDPAGGHQPMSNEDGTVWLLFNGAIYNAPQLRQDLVRRGHVFRSRSDTEVIVHAYEAFDLAALSRLNGMYAIALWDARRRRLLLARDPFGIKPLYVWDDGRRLRFASELKAFLTDPAFPRALDPIALDEFLSIGFVPSPRTLFAAARKLAPGHCAIVGDGRVVVRPFDRAAPEPTAVTGDGAARAELETHLAASIERQLLSDVPVGALLSGGIDSAAVVALMRQHIGRFPTFTVGFDGFALDETAAARRSAALLGTDHHDVVIGAADALEVLADAAWHLDEPIATSSALAMFHVSRLAAAHVKVVLTGQGADEPWAGYARYRGERLGRWYRQLPQRLRSSVVEPAARRLRDERRRRAIAALDSGDAAERCLRQLAPFTPSMKDALYGAQRSTARSDASGMEALRYWQASVSHLDPLAQQLYIETRTALPDDFLLYGDRMSMAFGLEARVPWLDRELMRFVEGLPIDLRMRGWAGHKHLLRQALRRWVPEEIARRRKIGFTTPVAAWLRGPLGTRMRERLHDDNSMYQRYFDARFVADLLDEHVDRVRDHSRSLFALLMVDAWHEQHVERARDAAR